MATIDCFSWKDVDRLSRQLAAKIDRSFDVIVCIMRGGAVIGVILANELNIDRVLSIKVAQNGQVTAVLPASSTGNMSPYQGRCGEVIVPMNDLDLTDLKVLVVDDVLDSGESARLVMDDVRRRGANSVRLATLHIKSYSRFKSDYYMEEKTNWLFYPWMSTAELEQMQARLTGAGQVTATEKDAL